MHNQHLRRSLYAATGVDRHFGLGDQVAKGRVSIVVERCKACGFCVEFCPTHVLALSSAFNSKGYHPPHVVHPEKCSGCDLCGMYCPDFAIYGTKTAYPKRAEAKSGNANVSEAKATTAAAGGES